MQNLMSMDVLRCDGRAAEEVRKLGDVIGHVVPGVALAVWGLHLLISASWRNALAERDPSAPRFHGRSWEPVLPFLPWPLWRRFTQAVPLDSLFKAFIALIFFFFPYHTILCPDGVRLGRITGQHIVNWAHSTLISAYVLVGFVELLGFRVRLPAGTSTAAMVLMHTVFALIFLSHQKHELLDQVSHVLLGYCFAAAAGCGLMEIAKPSCFIAFLGKMYFHILGGLWLAVVGHIIFGEHIFWSPTFDGQADPTPAMFVPVFFGQVMLAVCACLLVIYSAVDMMAAWELRRKGAPRGGEAGGGFPHLPVIGGVGGRGVGEESQGLLAQREGPAVAAAATLGDVQLAGVCCDVEGHRCAHRKNGGYGM